MKARSSTDLLAALTERTRENLRIAETFTALPPSALHQRPRPNSWNALECLAHLNHYGDYYLPEIRKRIDAAKDKGGKPTFTSSRLGNYFAAGMKPGPKTRKIKTFKSANPVNYGKKFDHTTVTEFIRQQNEMLDLLERAANVDLTRIKTGISISKLIKLRLGDTLRVVIYHNWRHIEQAQRALAAVPVA